MVPLEKPFQKDMERIGPISWDEPVMTIVKVCQK